MKKSIIIPTPTNEDVQKYLNIWDDMPGYTAKENALRKLFHDTYPYNKDIDDILIKVSTLNDFYSTNIFSVFPVAKHILSLDIDKRLEDADPTLVQDIALVTISGKEKQFYSFASKYCSHHLPEEYPIYDSYVDSILRYFREADHFAEFNNIDLKQYKTYKDILLSFRKNYGLTQYSLKDLDRYLWQLGKQFFPKSYKK